MNFGQRAQEQFQVGPFRCGVDAAAEACIARAWSDLSVEARNTWCFTFVGGPGSACICNQLRPVERFWMQPRSGRGVMSNVIERAQVILQLHYSRLQFASRPECAENDAIKPAVGR